MRRDIERRIAGVEASHSPQRYVFYFDETIPPGNKGPYARLPRPCATTEEWLELHAPKNRRCQ